jgi:predicted DNA-binding transcriptional regulator AlpA
MERENGTSHEERSENTWFTVKELAEKYNVSEVCIWLWVKAGRLPPPHKLGPQTRRWPPEAIEAFEADSQVRAER